MPIQKIKKNKTRFYASLRKDALKNCQVSINSVLRIGGYVKRPAPINDFIKVEEFGRFHFIQEDRGVWKLHYDTYGEECDHFSIQMPYKVTQELNRLGGIARKFKKHD